MRPGAAADLDACLALWVAACAARDGQAFAGVAERARPKFDAGVVWLVADGVDGADGFVLATRPGSGLPGDPADAPVLGLLATRPGAQAQGLGRALLREATRRLSSLGHERAVLHGLLDNVAAVRLYEGEGWVAAGEPYDHSLLKRPTQRFERVL
ncbi:N-acetyltransferase [Frigoribacterium sp. PhB24]|uniref:GNAT family N-acetyltransferase n=1 Tax=Frigoribacterium sp. PhB24 TaxID=2485204 RepID=UPI000F486B86|nr:GNAT family N-acetyltransferase [Frigoribacterium sp. PhB24]ROS50309.1 acetyltransferase (GNAT) family protein [Frigoribacterium sp. PhB24]